MTKAVFGLAANDEQARRIVESLLSSGFSNEDISILYPDRSKDKVRGVKRSGVEFNERGEVVEFDEPRDADFIERDAEFVDTPMSRNVKKGELTTEKHSKAPEGGVTGATAGGVLGGSLGLLAGIGALAIPGLGPFIAAGPILAALSGSAIGGSVGLLVGAIVGAGIPEFEAKKYEAGLKAGNILISVHTDDDEEIRLAKDIMTKEGAKDISSSTEKSKTRY